MLKWGGSNFPTEQLHLDNLWKVVYIFQQGILGCDRSRKIPGRVVEPSQTTLSLDDAEVLCEVMPSIL